MLSRQDLEAFAKKSGSDVFGVANIERFDELPAEKHPRAIFPEARSVIVLGRRIPRGALRGVEEGTNYLNYHLYGDEWLDNRFTSLVTFRVAECLEDAGWEAVPQMNLPPEMPPMGVPVAEGRPAPNVIIDAADAAVRAGVGEIGYCGLLLTPQFGPRQRIQMILTDAALAPTDLLTQPICDPAACKGACPVSAVAPGEPRTICGKKMPAGKVDFATCATCKYQVHPNRYHPSGKPDRLAAHCARACVDFLERSGRIGNRFATAFRIRPAWTAQ